MLEVPEKYRDSSLPKVVQWTRSLIRGAVQVKWREKICSNGL